MPMAKRCSRCALDFPYLTAFTTCVKCGEKLDTVTNGSPLSQLEANRLVAEAKFDAFYAEREEGRDGPTPEEVGAEEAKRLAEEWRQLEAMYGQS